MSTNTVTADRQTSYRDGGPSETRLGGGKLVDGRRASLEVDGTSTVRFAEETIHDANPLEKATSMNRRVQKQHVAVQTSERVIHEGDVYAGMKTGIHPLGVPPDERGDEGGSDDGLLPPSEGKKDDFHPGVHQQTYWFVTDIPTLGQSVESLAMTASGSSGDVGLSAGLKMSSTFAILTGALTMGVATERAQRAHEIGDVAGEQLATISQVRAGAEMSLGAVLGTLRGLTIAAVYTAARAVVSAAEIMGTVATGVGSAFYTLLAIPPAINATRQMQFSYEFAENRSMDFLFDQLRLTSEEHDEAAEVIPIDVYDDVVQMVTEEVELKAEEYEILTEREHVFIREKGVEIVNQIYAHHPSLAKSDAVERHVKVRLAKELARKMMVKEAVFTRNTGPEALREVKAELHGTSLKSADEIMDIVAAENKHAMIINILVVITCVIGIVGFVLATVFTGGAPLIAALAIIVASNVLMFALDLYSFIHSLKDMKAAPKDRILLMVCAALSIIFTAAGAFIAATPLARLIVILLGVFFAGCQVGVLGWSWYNHEQSEKTEKVE